MNPYIFFCLTTLMALKAHNAPELVCEEPDYDFGEVMGEPVIEHTFTLENKGEDKLIISRIQTSCGCTTAGILAMELEPGGKAELPVKMDLKGRSGKQRQHITLHSNDPDHPRMVLKMHGTAVAPIEISPRTLNLNLVSPQDLASGSGTVTLTSHTGEPFTIEKVDILNDRVTAEVIEAEDGLSASIVVTPLPQKGQGHFTDILRVTTSHPDIIAKRVLVMWQIRTGITVAPGVLQLRVLPDNTLQQRYLMVQGAPDMTEPLDVTGVTWGERDVDIKWIKVPGGVRIHLKDLRPSPDMSGEEIRITTNAPGFKVLTVPVRVVGNP